MWFQRPCPCWLGMLNMYFFCVFIAMPNDVENVFHELLTLWVSFLVSVKNTLLSLTTENFYFWGSP